MTAHELAQTLLQGPNHLVTVAGQGYLACVTHAATEAGVRTVVLYVAAPDPVELVLTSPEAQP